MTTDSIAVVPLRAGSKGLPGKNTRLLAGKPLFWHSLQHARAAGINRTLITTDIAELLSSDFGDDVTVAPRPEALATDMIPMSAVLRHVLAEDINGPATIVLLQATSPLRDPTDIRRAIDLHSRAAYDLVMSVTPGDCSVLKWGTVTDGRFAPLSAPEYCFTNRDELPAVFRPDGAIYVFDADWFRAKGELASGSIGAVQTNPERAHDIDTEADFEAVARSLERINDAG